MKPSVEILYITWNRLPYTSLTLPRALDQGGDVDYTVRIVDNGSTDGTVEYLRALDHPRISSIVYNEENLGISPVANAFWAESTADYLGKVDNDILLPDRWLEHIMRVHAASDPLVGVVGITHFSRDEIDELGDDALAHNVKTLTDGVQVFVQPYIGGACHAFPRELYEEFGEAEYQPDNLRSGWTMKQRQLYEHGRFPCYVYPWVTCIHLGTPGNPPDLPNLDPPETTEQIAGRRKRHQDLLKAIEPGRDWDTRKASGVVGSTPASTSKVTPARAPQEPLVSVIVNSYDYEPFLAEAIESVLSQTYQNVEVIVIDDGSSDRSPEIIQGFADRYPDRFSTVLHEENWGLCRSYNQGLSMASGEIIAGLSSDDVWPDDALEKRVEHLVSHRDIDVLVTDFDVIDSSGAIHSGDAKLELCPQFKPFFESDLEHLSEGLYERLLLGNFLPDPAITVSLRRIPMDEVRLDERCPEVSDWECNLRMAKRYRWAYLPEPTVRYRWHGDNVSWPKETWEHRGAVIEQRLYVLGKELAAAQSLDHRRVILRQIGSLWRRYSVMLPEE